MGKARTEKILRDAETHTEFKVLEWIANPTTWTRGSMQSYMEACSGEQPNVTFLQNAMGWDHLTYERALKAAREALETAMLIVRKQAQLAAPRHG